MARAACDRLFPDAHRGNTSTPGASGRPGRPGGPARDPTTSTRGAVGWTAHVRNAGGAAAAGGSRVVEDVTVALEGALPTDAHRAEDGPSGPTTLGEGAYRYEVSGANWGDKPAEWAYREATAVAVDKDDNVYVFNRGTKPML